MEKIITYKAKDGTFFETEEECLKYEESLEIFNVAETLKKYCEESMCRNCPFFKETCILSHPPVSWEWS